MNHSTNHRGSSHKACCTPSRVMEDELRATDTAALGGFGHHSLAQTRIEDGAFWMGDAFGDGAREDGEVPEHAVFLDAFEIDTTTVTNRDYAAFVAATGYVTDAERYGTSAVFAAHLEAEVRDVEGAFPGTPWWLSVRGADWRHPAGQRSSLEGVDSHPVVHVSWNDAMAYCRWANRQLPSEAQWERACRGGHRGRRYPWGDSLDAGSAKGWPCNIWQGRFPKINHCEDGWDATAPVSHFAANDYGLHQMVGNVWEWCADWFDARFYVTSPLSNPRGPAHGTHRAMRGGSFLCHDSYCNRYRNAARSSNTPESSASNIGFRTVSGDASADGTPRSIETT